MPSDSQFRPSLNRRALLHGLALFVALVVTVLAPGCATVPDRDPASGCANCPVCLHNADLACVCVKVAADTPRAEWDGKTWYFCSEECRTAFLADPKRFSPAGDGR